VRNLSPKLQSLLLEFVGRLWYRYITNIEPEYARIIEKIGAPGEIWGMEKENKFYGTCYHTIPP
jgi:hypothetical protein